MRFGEGLNQEWNWRSSFETNHKGFACFTKIASSTQDWASGGVVVAEWYWLLIT